LFNLILYFCGFLLVLFQEMYVERRWFIGTHTQTTTDKHVYARKKQNWHCEEEKNDNIEIK